MDISANTNDTEQVVLAVRRFKETSAWQRKLLPFLVVFLVAIAGIFFVISSISVYEMRNYVKSETAMPVRVEVEKLLKENMSRNPDVTQQGLLLLEADALDKRYRQAAALLMSRIWTRQLAFVTGMVMTFIGATFIIGKLSEDEANVNLSISEWKAGIISTSPGLILCFFGTLLMGTALLVQPHVEVRDSPLYFSPVGSIKVSGSETPTSATPTSAASASAPAPSFPDPFKKKPHSTSPTK